MTRKSKNALLYFSISLSINIFIAAAIYGATKVGTDVKYVVPSVKYTLITIVSIFNIIKLLVVLFYIWSEQKWKSISNRHPALKKIYNG